MEENNRKDTVTVDSPTNSQQTGAYFLYLSHSFISLQDVEKYQFRNLLED